jgi:hypothetical protein
MWSFHIVEPFPIGIVADDDDAALQVTRLLLLLRRLLSSPLLSFPLRLRHAPPSQPNLRSTAAVDVGNLANK